MVRLKIAYWEFDFKAVCPTLDHDLLSQAHIYIYMWNKLDFGVTLWIRERDQNQRMKGESSHLCKLQMEKRVLQIAKADSGIDKFAAQEN